MLRVCVCCLWLVNVSVCVPVCVSVCVSVCVCVVDTVFSRC